MFIPCSRVAHVFMDRHGYLFPDGLAASYVRNILRIVEVRIFTQSSQYLTRHAILSVHDYYVLCGYKAIPTDVQVEQSGFVINFISIICSCYRQKQ